VDIHGGNLDLEITFPRILDEEDRLQALELGSNFLAIGGHDLDATIPRAELLPESSPAGGTISVAKDDIAPVFIPHAHPSRRHPAHSVHAITQKNEELILNSSFFAMVFASLR
jgi:hypothetical protein